MKEDATLLNLNKYPLPLAFCIHYVSLQTTAANVIQVSALDCRSCNRSQIERELACIGYVHVYRACILAMIEMGKVTKMSSVYMHMTLCPELYHWTVQPITSPIEADMSQSKDEVNKYGDGV